MLIRRAVMLSSPIGLGIAGSSCDSTSVPNKNAAKSSANVWRCDEAMRAARELLVR
jgi:hypothetical protein